MAKPMISRKQSFLVQNLVSQFSILSNPNLQESSFGTNSRFGHRSKKIFWPFVLGILDDCKCSENFLAQTITTPIRLRATFSFQIVDGLCDAEAAPGRK
jgi:hypothetical protein